MRMDRKIQLQRKTAARDPATGAQLDSWSTYANVFARREQSFNARAPDEREQSGVEAYQAIYTYTVHWRSDVATADRIIDGDAVVEVVSVVEIERRIGLKIGAKEWTHE